LVSEPKTNLFAFYSREKGENFIVMPPRRRDRRLPDPADEREMTRRRDRKIPDPARERDIHELHARMDAMETAQRHTVNVGDISEDESENEAGNEEVAVEDAAEERLFRVGARIGVREKMDIPVYEGNLDVEELLD
jgi:hypothetical protein